MPETVYESCTHCVLIRCLRIAPKIAIRRKCTKCNKIWIISWALKYDESHYPGTMAIRFGVCPQGQKIATEYLNKCPDCAQKEYKQRQRFKGICLKEHP